MTEQLEKPPATLEEIKASLEVNGRFKDLRVDYRVPFQSIENELKRKEGIETVVIVYINQPERQILGPLQVAEIEILLGKRAGEERKEWGAGTWAPPMGRIEKEDINDASQIARNREKEWRKFSHGDFIKEVAARERREEIKGMPAQTLTLVCQPFKDLETERTVHVVVEIIQAVSTTEGRESRKWQLLEGKRDLKTRVPPESDEHTEFRWFKLEEVPEDMEPGSKKAILSAIETLDKENLIIG